MDEEKILRSFENDKERAYENNSGEFTELRNINDNKQKQKKSVCRSF